MTVTSNEEKSSCESRSASEKDFELTGCELDNEVQSKSPIDSVGFSASSNSSIVSNSFISKSPSIVSISPSLPMEKPVDTDVIIYFSNKIFTNNVNVIVFFQLFNLFFECNNIFYEIFL